MKSLKCRIFFRHLQTARRDNGSKISFPPEKLSGFSEMLLELGTGNGGWERVYSSNPPENSKWRTKEKKWEQFGEI